MSEAIKFGIKLPGRDEAFSFLAVTISAAIWIFGALIVAFPERLFDPNIVVLLQDFLSSAKHGVTLLMLLLLDIVISILILNDPHVKQSLTDGNRVGVWILGIAVFVAISLVGPNIASPQIQAHCLVFGAVAFIAFAIPRGMAYAPPQRARRIGSVTE